MRSTKHIHTKYIVHIIHYAKQQIFWDYQNHAIDKYPFEKYPEEVSSKNKRCFQNR